MAGHYDTKNIDAQIEANNKISEKNQEIMKESNRAFDRGNEIVEDYNSLIEKVSTTKDFKEFVENSNLEISEHSNTISIESSHFELLNSISNAYNVYYIYGNTIAKQYLDYFEKNISDSEYKDLIINIINDTISKFEETEKNKLKVNVIRLIDKSENIRKEALDKLLSSLNNDNYKLHVEAFNEFLELIKDNKYDFSFGPGIYYNIYLMSITTIKNRHAFKIFIKQLIIYILTTKLY